MNLRDADSGKILWQSTDDFSVPDIEHEGKCGIKPDILKSARSKENSQMQISFSRNQFFLKRAVGKFLA
ncbi:unnamed protein product [Schistosoma guineensis]|nr:unnamed protein product [Schistosoma guineensis]